jgi:hypothetical protein
MTVRNDEELLGYDFREACPLNLGQIKSRVAADPRNCPKAPRSSEPGMTVTSASLTSTAAYSERFLVDPKATS